MTQIRGEKTFTPAGHSLLFNSRTDWVERRARDGMGTEGLLCKMGQVGSKGGSAGGSGCGQGQNQGQGSSQGQKTDQESGQKDRAFPPYNPKSEITTPYVIGPPNRSVLELERRTMEIERLLRLDEEAVLLDSDLPSLRSLSMSRNLALSVVEEVPHMIRPTLSDRSSRSNRNKGEGMSGSSRRSSTSTLSSTESSPQHPTIRGVRKNEVLTGVVVSKWDNIVGPQAVYLWTEELTSIYYPQSLPPHLSGVVKYVTDHTVDHQDVDGEGFGPNMERCSLCLVPELGLVYASISVRVPSGLDAVLEFASNSSMTGNDPDQPVISVPHSVAVLGDLKYVAHFLLLRPLIAGWLREFGMKIGLLVCKDRLHSSMINSWCAELCKSMTALKNCWVQKGVGEGGILRELEQEYLPPKLRHVNNSDWSVLLSSHLCSSGSSVIVGFDNLAVNQVIRFLLCFATREEGYCSRYSLTSIPDTFMKGLLVQGLTLGGIGERSISYNQVVSNRLPISYIELGSKLKVKRVPTLEHETLRSKVLMGELRALWISALFLSPQEDPYSELVKEAAAFVTQFINELSLLPLHRRYARLLLFRRFLHGKTIAFVAYLQSISHLPLQERGRLARGIQQTFRLSDPEYLILQVQTEKLRPGTLSLLREYSAMK